MLVSLLLGALSVTSLYLFWVFDWDRFEGDTDSYWIGSMIAGILFSAAAVGILCKTRAPIYRGAWSLLTGGLWIVTLVHAPWAGFTLLLILALLLGCIDPCGDPCEGAACTCGEAAGLPLVARASAGGREWRFAHHPPLVEFSQDVYRVGTWRLCVGCFTTWPAYLLVLAALALASLQAGTMAWIGGGFALASLQAISAAGLARRRPTKVMVKSALGAGLALVSWGVLQSGWPPAGKTGFLLLTLVLAQASALPRTRRIESVVRRHRGDEGPILTAAGTFTPPTKTTYSVRA